jgi:hypothetical protein
VRAAGTRRALVSGATFALLGLFGFFIPALAASASPRAGASRHIRVTPADRAATRALLSAQYAYEQSFRAALPAARPVTEARVQTLAGECPGVLANAPRGFFGRFGEEEPKLTARQRGEENRSERQHAALEFEISEAFGSALIEADRAGILAYAHTVRSLRWSNAGLTLYEHARSNEAEQGLTEPMPHVCSDLKAWAASNYTRLPEGTKAFLREISSSSRAEFRALFRGGLDAERLLMEYEGPQERALARRILKLTEERARSYDGLEESHEKLDKALGTRSFREEVEEPPKGAVVIANGQTAAGPTYKVWVEPHRPRPPIGPGHCDISIVVEQNEAHSGFGGNSASGACLSRTRPEPPQVSCHGRNWEVSGQTVEGAVNVDLTLRGGAQVTSPVALVPPSLGGPAGFYFQVLPRSQDPVSLTELDANGKVLATVNLSHQAHCSVTHPPRTKPPEFLPVRKIVSGHVPHGPAFHIFVERSRFGGHLETNLELTVFPEEVSVFSLIIARTVEGGESNGPRGRAVPFKLKHQSGCTPHEYTVLYGLLKAPRDSVFARTGHGLRRFLTAGIPQGIHLHGVVAYIALSAMPQEVIVRSPDGHTVFRENLRTEARETRETCEGESES